MKTTMKIRMMAAGAACLCAALSASATNWTYSEESGKNYITDGQWKLQVGKLTAESNTVKIAWLTSWTDPKNDTSGVLDLRSPLKIKIGESEATITSVNLASLWSSSNTTVVKFYCDIVGSLTKGVFNNSSKMTTLDIGGSATTFPCPLLEGCTSLVTAEFNFPGLRTVGDTGSLFSGKEGNAASLQDIDVSTIAGPGVTTVKDYALKCTKITGDLVLTNVVSLGKQAFLNAKLTCVSLAGSLGSLPSQAFEGSMITNVVLDLPSLSSIDSTAFTSQKKIRRVELVTALPDMNLLKNIVSAADNTDFNELVIYVSMNQWKKSARDAATYSSSNTSGIFRELKDDEKSSAPDGAFGVFVVDGADKGVFVHKASHSDPEPGTWTYKASTSTSTSTYTITDGQWTFKVRALTTDSDTVRIAWLDGWEEPSDASKTGILDLRAPLKVAINGTKTEIKSVELGEKVFAYSYSNTDKISEFYCDIVSSMASATNFFQGNHSISNVVIGGSAEMIPPKFMYDCKGATNIVFDLPNLKSVAGDAFGYEKPDKLMIRSVELQSAFTDMGQITNIVRYAGGTAANTAASTGCRVYVSKRQWTKEARDAAAEAGYFAGMGTFTENEKAKIATDPTLARAYGVLVVGGVRKAFVVNKASPYDKIQGLMIIIQ